MYLMHVGPDPVSDVIRSKVYTFLPGEPTEVADDFIAQRILAHKQAMGLVEVPVTKSRLGLQVNIEEGEKIARQALKRSRKAMVDEYVRTQREDRIRFGMPALAPHGTVAKIIEQDHIKLPFTPVGGDVEYPDEAKSDRMANLEEANRLLMEQVKLLRERFEQMELKPKK